MYPDDFIKSLQKYKEKLDIDLIEKACRVAQREHEGQLRKSGEPYVTHTLSTAYNLIQYNFDTATICAGILHDIIEDTQYSEEELKNNFGDDVLNLVLGVTKLSKINMLSQEEFKVENLRKFILSLIGDIRVLIIKLFDRLDNIRTIKYIANESKRKRIAQETLDIYVPLAERISLHEIKDELEDLSFQVVNYGVRDSILRKIDEVKGNYAELLQNIETSLVSLLKQNNIEIISFKGRIKKPYSIWKKIKKNKSSFEDIFDILAFRVITKNAEDCYRVLYAIHSKYRAIFYRFKDFISSPKPNNYQSLHTAIFFKDNVKLEIQIRTEEMDIFAENGIAAHWNYKNPVNNIYDIAQYSWLKNLVSILNDIDTEAEDLYEYSKLEIFTNQIFVFTPKGEVIDLPKNACALDFAYAIHTDIGNTCTSVTIDGVDQSIFTELQNGQRIEVHTNKNQEPQALWLSFVKTGLAKLNIKKHLRQKRQNMLALQANSVLNYTFEKEGVNFYPEITSKIMEVANIKSKNTFYEKIIEGRINIHAIIEELYPYLRHKHEDDVKDVINKQRIGLAIKTIHFSECCYAVYGDSIVGVYLPDGRLEIHHSSCEILYSSWVNSLNVIRLYWKEQNSYTYTSKLCLDLSKKPGAVAHIANILAEDDIPIESIRTENIYNSEDYVKLYITFKVKDLKELEGIMDKIKKSKFTMEVERYIN